MGNTSIEWTDRTWNPVRGCSRVSEGCRNCYAERIAARFASAPPLGMPETTGNRAGPFHGFVQIANGHPAWTGKVELVEKHLKDPLHWHKSARVFVNSMSDLFHEALPDEAIDRVFAVMALCPQHTFQALTKRPERMLNYCSEEGRYRVGIAMFNLVQDLGYVGNVPYVDIGRPPEDALDPGDPVFRVVWPLPNVWLGVSVEDREKKRRIDVLRETPAAIRFLSIEPLLEDIGELDLRGIHWVIVGGESGPGARPMKEDWARSVRDQCQTAGVAFFFKQWGGVRKQAAGAMLDGREWREFPEVRA